MNESNLPNEQILFIKKIKKLRELNTWTIKKLAKISGVSSGYISDIEAGLNKSIGKNIFSKLYFAFKKNSEFFSKEDELDFILCYARLTLAPSAFEFIEKLIKG